jgi:hypothetical protein
MGDGCLPITREPTLATATPAAGSTSAGLTGGLPPHTTRRLREPLIATWPVEVDAGFADWRDPDPWAATVHDTIEHYRTGHADLARRRWTDDIRWRIPGDAGLHGEWVGAEQVFKYHRLLRRETDNTFRQRLVALEGSQGPFVNAHLRTTARRSGRVLDIATLVVFELSGGRVSVVTEMPGDREAWASFWAR